MSTSNQSGSAQAAAAAGAESTATLAIARKLIQQMIPMMKARAETNFRRADSSDRKGNTRWGAHYRHKGNVAEHWLEEAEEFLSTGASNEPSQAE